MSMDIVSRLRQWLKPMHHGWPDRSMDDDIDEACDELILRQDQLFSAKEKIALKDAALMKIIEMNRQYTKDKYGDPEQAENMACVRVARSALANEDEGRAR